jgi:GMP synthase-like glutamine amidotransferase
VRIAILEHDPHAPPGRILDLFHEWGAEWEVIERHRGAPLPSPRDFFGYILLGGEPSLLSPPSWLKEEIPFLQSLFSNPKTPILGICLGAQLLALSLGGKIVKRPSPEIEIRHSIASASPRGRTFLQGLPSRIPFLQWHEEIFLTPPHAFCLLRSEKDRAHDGFLYGHVLAIQGHLEVTEKILKRWMEATPSVQGEILKEFTDREPLFISALRILLYNLFLSVP